MFGNIVQQPKEKTHFPGVESIANYSPEQKKTVNSQRLKQTFFEVFVIFIFLIINQNGKI